MRQNYQISEQFPSRKEEEALKFPIFLLQEYLDLFKGDKSICPILIRGSNHEIIAYWIFQEEADYWYSPVSAPFSCPQLYKELELNELLQYTQSYLRNKSNKPIRFVLNSLFSGHHNFIFSKILKVEINHIMKIDRENFIEKIPQKRRRQKLRAIKRDNYTVTEVLFEQWEIVYKQNLKWRIQKGHHNFIPLNLMCLFKKAFPQNYLGYQLSYSGRLIGCAFVVKVSEDYLYLYSLVTDPDFDKQEPSLLLNETIYDFAKISNIKKLDMGTSMNLDGKIHRNIAQYKQDLGALAIRKYTFEC